MHETCTKTQCNPHRILWVVWPLIKPINQANVMTNLLSNSHSRYDVRLRHQNLTQFKTNIIVQTISDKHHSPTNPSLQNCLSKKKKQHISVKRNYPNNFWALLPTNISHPNPFFKKKINGWHLKSEICCCCQRCPKQWRASICQWASQGLRSYQDKLTFSIAMEYPPFSKGSIFKNIFKGSIFHCYLSLPECRTD